MAKPNAPMKHQKTKIIDEEKHNQQVSRRERKKQLKLEKKKRISAKIHKLTILPDTKI